ncbi:host-nuclease inhibitor Gam family protein [Azospirillum doebereinerae]|uniref:Nuclease inhibitor protein n=1 Tax=Azospirillum doebereinerae TaxID=92933 RepID=A0A433J007_9PROT|nr:host-nuclease inhibitor Gam family protein [Azospirillum doebereinerae]RUQ62001.1 nuclease inhibitor protein [Azospirillum doebereinerae]
MPDIATAPARRPAAPRVRNRDEATAALGRIGAAQAQLVRLETARDVGIASLKLDFETAAAPLRAAIEADTDRLRGWIEANRAELLPGKKRSLDFTTGTAGFRKAAERVVVAEGINLLEALETDRKLKRFVRIKREPDLQALLKESAVAITIKGVLIGGGDDAFFVKPLMLSAT